MQKGCFFVSKKTGSSGPSTAWVSQNFLTSGRLIGRLLQKTSIRAGDRLIEIGPGKGHITKALLDRGSEVTAVEIDPALAAGLRQKLGDDPRLNLVQADFLSWRLPRFGNYKVFSNLPFNQTTAIVRKLTEAANPPEEAWLILERGAALRFLGRPRESLRSLLLKPRFEMKILHRLSRTDFHPAPSVDAVMLHLRRKSAPDVPPAQWRQYERFVSGCLSKGGPAKRLSKGRIAAALKQSGPADGRSGTMLYVQWLCLFRCWLGRNR